MQEKREWCGRWLGRRGRGSSEFARNECGGAVRDYRKLHVWERAHRFVVRVYEASRRFPDEERFGLTSQLRRACVSVPSNVAEGAGRRPKAEFAHFIDFALGSTNEVEYQLFLALELGFLDHATWAPLDQELGEIRRMLTALHRSIAP